MFPWKCESAPAPIAWAMRWQSRSIGPGVLMSSSNVSSAVFGPSLYEMFANACSKQWKSVASQSSIFVSSGLKPAATEPPIVEERVDSETNSATWLICASFSFFEKDGMPDAAVSDLACDRLRVGAQLVEVGPDRSLRLRGLRACGSRRSPRCRRPSRPAARSSSARALVFLLPPQPARARKTRPRKSRARMGDARTRHIQAEGLGRVESESDGTRTFPRWWLLFDARGGRRTATSA